MTSCINIRQKLRSFQMRAGFLDITPCKQLSSTYSRPIRKQIEILDQSDCRLTLIDAERVRSSARSKFSNRRIEPPKSKSGRSGMILFVNFHMPLNHMPKKIRKVTQIIAEVSKYQNGIRIQEFSFWYSSVLYVS